MYIVQIKTKKKILFCRGICKRKTFILKKSHIRIKMIKVCNVEVLENPSNFLQPFQFKITFTADEDIKNDEYEWKIVYVGSAESKDFDQVLLSESLGFYSKGQHDLILRSASIDPDKIPKDELLAPSVVLLVGYHKNKQFFQVGYLVVKEYLDDEEPDIITEYDKLQKTTVEDFSRIISDVGDSSNKENESVTLPDAFRNINAESLDAINNVFGQLYESFFTANLC